MRIDILRSISSGQEAVAYGLPLNDFPQFEAKFILPTVDSSKLLYLGCSSGFLLKSNDQLPRMAC